VWGAHLSGLAEGGRAGGRKGCISLRLSGETGGKRVGRARRRGGWGVALVVRDGV
jgi:hypothetical protein